LERVAKPHNSKISKRDKQRPTGTSPRILDFKNIKKETIPILPPTAPAEQQLATWGREPLASSHLQAQHEFAGNY